MSEDLPDGLDPEFVERFLTSRSAPAMQTQFPRIVLNALEPIQKFASLDSIEEIFLNTPCQIIIKRRDGKKQFHEAPWADHSWFEHVCRLMANLSKQKWTLDGMPILYAGLPGDNRFTAIGGENVRYYPDDQYGMCFALRIHTKSKIRTIEDFRGTGNEVAISVEHKRYADDQIEDIALAAQNGESVILSGPTGTGKTTVLNDLLERIPRNKRLISVEDSVREISFPNHPDHVHLVASRTGGTGVSEMRHFVDAVKRMTPDCLMPGEVSTANVEMIFNLLMSGHSNMMSTIHAPSPEGAIITFWQNLMFVKPGLTFDIVRDVLSKYIGRIVQIERSSDHVRFISRSEIPELINWSEKQIKNT